MFQFTYMQQKYVAFRYARLTHIPHVLIDIQNVSWVKTEICRMPLCQANAEWPELRISGPIQNNLLKQKPLYKKPEKNPMPDDYLGEDR